MNVAPTISTASTLAITIAHVRLSLIVCATGVHAVYARVNCSAALDTCRSTSLLLLLLPLPLLPLLLLLVVAMPLPCRLD